MTTTKAQNHSQEIDNTTLKKIASSYIQAAEKAIDDGHKDNYERFSSRLKKRNLNFGVCWYSLKTFYIDITFHSKVEEHTIGKDDFVSNWRRQYWYPSPHEASTKKQLVEMLQARIQILEDWL